MITGDTRLSPNNDADIKAITKDDNIYKEDENGNIIDISGEIIKVVLISQAGSEGLDFKAIRQIHILEPWYNINRIEQIIGRGVRNFSHKDLPFKKRNVQIFLYGTILDNSEEESADLYVYRVAETKAVKIGKVTRLLKQTAVDCIINHDQTKFTPENFQTKKENNNVEQELSDHKVINDFEIGDKDNSATCDFMECEFKCLPNIIIKDSELNTDTYNETFMLVNSDKIIQKIKLLMKMRYFYKKKNLFEEINIPKKYPNEQIYSALTQMITDNAEYITDKYGRTGYLVNIGDYYLFQPSELNYKNISVYDRSVPINYKHNMVKFKIKADATKSVIDKRNFDIIEEEKTIEEMP
jgi:superfamily II DNA or RNA helicase